MSTLVFDTFENVKKLRAVGFTEAQAEAQTRIIADLVDAKLVTQQYLDERLRDLEFRLKEMESRMIIRLGAMVVVAIGVVATLVKIL